MSGEEEESIETTVDKKAYEESVAQKLTEKSAEEAVEILKKSGKLEELIKQYVPEQVSKMALERQTKQYKNSLETMAKNKQAYSSLFSETEDILKNGLTQESVSKVETNLMRMTETSAFVENNNNATSKDISNNENYFVHDFTGVNPTMNFTEDSEYDEYPATNKSISERELRKKGMTIEQAYPKAITARMATKAGKGINIVNLASKKLENFANLLDNSKDESVEGMDDDSVYLLRKGIDLDSAIRDGSAETRMQYYDAINQANKLRKESLKDIDSPIYLGGTRLGLSD